tara:strand:- start:90 stop:365 length:276 start_codon:yes stop_codon:yes gene_type:complete
MENSWFPQTRQWFENNHSTNHSTKTKLDQLYQPSYQQPYYIEQTEPIPIQLNRQGDVDDDKNPIVPSMWWLFIYLGLTALTAIGIRQSLKE